MDPSLRLDAQGRPAGYTVALPGGHPEGFIEAFSQLYTDFAERVTARLEKRSPASKSSWSRTSVPLAWMVVSRPPTGNSISSDTSTWQV